MRGITLHLNDLVEERERRQKRQAAALAVAAALAAFAAGLQVRQPAAPPPEIRIEMKAAAPVQWPEIAPIAMTVVRREDADDRPQRVVRDGSLVMTRHLRGVDGPGVMDTALSEHLCASPRTIRFGTKAVEHVTISNPSERVVAVTQIAAHTDRVRSSFSVDSSECDRKFLWPGDRCRIAITLRERIGETMEMYVYNDAGEPERLTIVAAERR